MDLKILKPKTKKRPQNSRKLGAERLPFSFSFSNKNKTKKEVKTMARKPTTSDKISAVKMGLKIYLPRRK
jgi:hypothetical protein